MGYKKKEPSFIIKAICKTVYRKYPKLVRTLMDEPSSYNHMIRELEELEGKGCLFVIRPERSMAITRIEKNVRKLVAGYLQGRDDMEKLLPALQSYLEGIKE